ncbi:hypothetical protein [Flavobacterium piscisymbiosum]|uniref:DUF3828 domain-containing protein n=1 Tax=Flavobacterium piscisymbiosum TaxID=2893753 RepID=A0ABS8MED3_9FLAO|nr:hypothetical protein [Flavobacterium sp. F-30]MCC9063883.1 hypothetical protein [Flavobacterium sp. F-30]
MKFSTLFFLSFIFTSLVSFKPVDTKQAKHTNTSIYFATDKQQLETLIRKTYEWIETKKTKVDFDVVENKKGDKYVALNTKTHNKILAELKNSNFFAQQFIDNYNKIALKIGENLKTNKIEYFVGELPPYGSDSNPWCECQDYPESYWKTLKINDLKIQNNKATFYWTWTEWKETPKYKVTAVKENGIWKIAVLDGFNYQSFTKI